MREVTLRIRPREVVTALDPDALRARARSLEGWDAHVHDTRAGDATFLTVIARAETVDDDAVRRLRDAFADLPGMRALVWRGPRDEIPLEDWGG